MFVEIEKGNGTARVGDPRLRAKNGVILDRVKKDVRKLATDVIGEEFGVEKWSTMEQINQIDDCRDSGIIVAMVVSNLAFGKR